MYGIWEKTHYISHVNYWNLGTLLTLIKQITSPRCCQNNSSILLASAFFPFLPFYNVFTSSFCRYFNLMHLQVFKGFSLKAESLHFFLNNQSTLFIWMRFQNLVTLLFLIVKSYWSPAKDTVQRRWQGSSTPTPGWVLECRFQVKRMQRFQQNHL